MKILGISLLRLGDLVMQRPLIEGLRKTHPQSEIHMLINHQFSQVEFLFDGLVDQFIYFDRESLQKSCGEKEYNIFWGFHQLKAFVQEMNTANYDVVYNFTHNRLTAHLTGLIETKQRVGIYSENSQFFGLTTPWIQFFNNYFGRPEATGFHYTEILARALGIPLSPSLIHKSSSSGKKTILIQPLTSDVKKNWQIESFKSLVEILEKVTAFEVKVLGAPFERDSLQKSFSEKNLLICNFQEAAEALKSAALLITGDTSIKHLGTLYDVPMLELCLGSSQPLQVGAYSNNTLILQSRVSCGPCPHSLPCSQTKHFCGETMSVAAVFKAARALLGLEIADWDGFARKRPELNVLKTEIRHGLGWTVQCFSPLFKNQFDKIIQTKTMIINELNHRAELNQGGFYEQRTRKLSGNSAEAS